MTTRDVSPFEPRSHERREGCSARAADPDALLELEELRRYEQRTPEIQAKERRLEQLRWRLASVARRSASDDLDAAARTAAASRDSVRGLALVGTPLCGEPGSGVQTTVAPSDGVPRATACSRAAVARELAESREGLTRFASTSEGTTP